MTAAPFDLQAVWSVLVATLGGMAIGIERQWSGHAAGPRARFAGVRTFTLLGLVSGLCGWLWAAGIQGPALVFLAGLCGLVVAAYLAASRHDVEGTTEVAAFVVMAAGVLAGSGRRPVASAIVALTALLLVEKKRLHAWVRALDREEVRAGTRFAVMATVILPLLPSGPYGPYDVVKPRLLWALVLFFSGFSFIGYVARRLAGPSRGYVLTGTLGGAVSSTSVTLTSAELSRTHPDAGRPLAAGAIGASVLLLPRVLISSAVLAPPLARSLWQAMIAPALIGIVLTIREWRHTGKPHSTKRDDNPLQFGSAIKMAALFQIVLFGVSYVTSHFGDRGLYASAAVLGLADVDALTVSMARLTTNGTDPSMTAHAVLIGIIANTMVKLGITLSAGRGTFRPLAAIGLILMGAALAAWLYF